MGYECLKCSHDLVALINFDTLCEEFIECPSCGNRMTVEYDENWDEETETEQEWWWLEKYNK